MAGRAGDTVGIRREVRPYLADDQKNRIQNQLKLFGRNKFNNSVIFIGDENNIGKIVKVKIESTNQNSLFGKIENNEDMKAA